MADGGLTETEAEAAQEEIVPGSGSGGADEDFSDIGKSEMAKHLQIITIQFIHSSSYY